MIRRILFLLALLIVIAACARGPTLVRAPQPTLTVDASPFEKAGCPMDATGWPRCLPEGPLGSLGCDVMRPAPDLLGGLEPAYPIALCEIYPLWHPEDPLRSIPALESSKAYIRRTGGLAPVYVRYAIFREGTFAVLEDLENLRSTYAPISSATEALSYALAATGFAAQFGLKREPGYIYALETIQDTYAKPIEGGYVVLLYDYHAFGCGPHWTDAVEVFVSTQGDVMERRREHAFRNPAEDALCRD